MSDWNRRKLLVAGTALCTACMVGCTPDADPVVEAGPVSDYQAGELIPVWGSGVAVGRDEEGLYALSTICTHASCDIASQGEVTQEELVCDCHGSVFDGVDGAVLEGPAREPLIFYEVFVEEGQVLVDTSVTAGPQDRTPV